jgi:glycosyltransferase involved in cell wall biosynthesis
MSKLSIIIPVYNVQEYLANCIDSIINQDYPFKEVILINDGSTDGSAKILEFYKVNYPDLIVIEKTNGGLSSARNAGLDIATGDFVTFVDSDDYLDLNTYSSNMEFLNQNSKIDILSFPLRKISEFSTIEISSKEIQIVENKIEIIKEYLIGTNISNSVCNKIFRAKIFKEIRFEFGRLNEDTLFIPQLMENVNGMIISSIGFYNYRVRMNSIITTMRSDKFVRDNFDGQFALCEMARKYKLVNLSEKYLINAFWIYLNSIRTGNEFNDYFYNKLKTRKFHLMALVFYKKYNLKKKIKLAIYSLMGRAFYLNFLPGK